MSNFLDSVGLTYLWGKIKAAFVAKADISPVSTLDIDSTPTANSSNLVTSGGVYNAIPSTYAGSATAGGTADRTSAIPFGVVDSTSTSTAYTATVSGITELVDGTCVLLKNSVVTSAANFTININNLGAKPSYNNMATGNPITPTAPTRDTTIFNINYTMLFIYSSTLVDGGAWICYRGYDANTNTIGYQLRTNSYSKPMTDVTYRYRILFSSADDKKWVPSTTSTSTNATSSRAVCQTPINPFGEIVYYGTTASVAAGSRPAATSLWQQYTLTFGYAFNRTGAALTLTSWTPVYIKCTPQANGSAIIDADTPYVQGLPTTEDGKIYIFLGVAYSATAVEMLAQHPVYYYKDGAIRVWTNAAETDTSSLAPKESPALTGTPTAPTATTGTNTTQIATTAFVQQELQASGGGTVDDELDPESENPVQNKVLTEELYEIEPFIEQYEYVDLGLPSGVLWAKYNLNADGNSANLYHYFYWAGINKYDSYQNTVPYLNTTSLTYTKYNATDGIKRLEMMDDAAHCIMGDEWEIPSAADWQELFDNCSFQHIAIENYDNIKVTGLNGNSINIPLCNMDDVGVTGTYLTCDLSTTDIRLAKKTVFNSSTHNIVEEARATARSIRPIMRQSPPSFVKKGRKSLSRIQNITYSELKELRDNSQLVPGQQYRITNFVTTVGGTDWSGYYNASAMHPFDIIVTADSPSILNENARAIQHEGDTYFADSNLAAWELKYSLDYSVITEPLSSVKTDNALIISRDNGATYELYVNEGSKSWALYGGNITTNSKVSDYDLVDFHYYGIDIETNNAWNYVTSSSSTVNIGDTVTTESNTTATVLDVGIVTYENRGFINYMKDECNNECYYDFKNVLFCDMDQEYLNSLDYFYTFTSYAGKDATVEGGNYTVVWGNINRSNIARSVFVETRSQGNSICDNCIMNDCDMIIIRGNAESCYIGQGCSYVYLAGASNNGKRNIVIGNNCSRIEFSGPMMYCNIGASCTYITTGTNSNSITIRQNCSYIKFGTSSTVKNYYRNITIDAGNRNIFLNNTQTTSSTNYCQNIHVHHGVNNSTTYKQIDIGVVGNQYGIDVKSANATEITA